MYKIQIDLAAKVHNETNQSHGHRATPYIDKKETVTEGRIPRKPTVAIYTVVVVNTLTPLPVNSHRFHWRHKHHHLPQHVVSTADRDTFRDERNTIVDLVVYSNGNQLIVVWSPKRSPEQNTSLSAYRFEHKKTWTKILLKIECVLTRFLISTFHCSYQSAFFWNSSPVLSSHSREIAQSCLYFTSVLASSYKGECVKS